MSKPNMPVSRRAVQYAAIICLLLWSTGLCSADEGLKKVFQAVKAGDRKSVAQWLRRGGDPRASFGGSTLLAAAAHSGQTNIVPLLIAHGADINAASTQGTALFYAVAAGKSKAAQLLLYFGADVRARGPSRETPLHRAAAAGDLSTANVLILAGAVIDAAEARGLTPLMLAAWKGHSKVAQLLLANGADPKRKSKTGLSSVHFARASKNAGVLKVVKNFQADPSVPVGALTPPPGTDLSKLSSLAKDGQVIVLGPGEYPGTVFVTGKRLTLLGDPNGRTVLVGPKDGDRIAQVAKGGSLHVRRVNFLSRNNLKFGLFVKSGKVRLEESTFSQVQTGVYVDTGQAVLRSCSFTQISKMAILAFKSKVSIRDSKFLKCTQAVHAENGSELTVIGCSFMETPEGVYATGQRIFLKYNAYAAKKIIKDRAAFNVRSKGPVIVVGNQIIGQHYGVSIRTEEGKPLVAVTGNTIVNGDIGLTIDSMKEAAGSPFVYVTGNFICNTQSAGLLLARTKSAVLLRNFIVPAAKYAVFCEDGVGALVRDSVFYGPTKSIGLLNSPGDGLRLKNVRLVDMDMDRLSDETISRDASTASFEYLARQGGSASRIKAAAARVNAVATKLTLPQTKPLTDAIVSFTRELRSVQNKAKGLARLRVRVIDRTGQKVRVDYRLYHATGDRPGHLGLTAGDLKAPADLVARLASAKDPVSGYIFSKLPPALQDQVKKHDGKKLPPPMRRALVEALNRSLPANDFYEVKRFAHVKLSDSVKGALAKENKTPADWRSLNRRLLESAYPDEIVPSGYWVPKTDPRGFAYLAPGPYWVVVQDCDAEPRGVILKAGRPRDVEIPARSWQRFVMDRQGWEVRKGLPKKPEQLRSASVRTWQKANGRWFRATVKFEKARPMVVFLPLKSPMQMRRAIARIRRVDRGSFAFRRFGVPQQQRASFLANARKTLSELKPPADDQLAKRHWTLNRKCLARIMSAHGNVTDIKRILAHCEAADGEYGWGEKRFWTPIIAYMETRLGVLETGRLAGLLKSRDRHWAALAAVYLHEYGSALGDPALMAYLIAGDPKNVLIDEVAWSLLDTADPKVLKGMRRQLKVELADAKDALFGRARIRGGVLLYLLAYGSPKDWSAIGALTHDPDVAKHLVFITSEPGLLAGLPHDEFTYLQMQSALRTHPQSVRKRTRAKWQVAAFSGIQGSYWDAHPDARKTMSMRINRYQVWGQQERYRAWSTYWRPWLAARCLVEGGPPSVGPLVDRLTWSGRLCDPSDLNASTSEGLDYLAGEKLQESLKRLREAWRLPSTDLLSASHRLTSRAFYNSIDDCDDGVERRAYDLKHPSKWDVIAAGLVEVRMRLVDDILQLRYRQNLSFLPGVGRRNIAPKAHLYRGDRELPIRLGSRLPDGSYLYEAKLGRQGLSNLYFVARLKAGKDVTPITFDLFASRYARKLRRLRTLDRKMKRETQARPDDPAAWTASARVSQAMGRVDQAMLRYQKAINLDLSNEDVWQEAADMCAKLGRHEKAAELLRAMAKRFPGNPANWYDLASQLYLIGAYKEAAEACGKTLSLRPDHADARAMQGACLFLSGDRFGAAQAVARIPAGPEWERVIPLWYLGHRTSKRPAPNVTETVDRRYKQLKGKDAIRFGLLLGRSSLKDALDVNTTPANLCRAHCFAGYGYLLAGKTDAAAKSFAKAVAVGTHHQLEARMARVELEKLR